ncbi:unnamed protein product [Adineta steineri]|uniref:Uncharacterized protein n=2 Tax=Adineta steineri TaxID=433720 RepID=A0A813RT54_9BILA|nr:unnamed protein product [Adineta steineri]CAF3644107.1 unnamed protein product [Adineta steineri]
MLRFLILFLICFSYGKTQQNFDVIGCGGFIKSETDINYKVVRIQLITKDGIPIYTTEAAPVNGYYMIPVYERGEYILKLLPPSGWSFDPSQIELNIDGETDPCTLNHDLNFAFRGFGLAGRVISAGNIGGGGGGPAGVTLTLYQDNKKLNETKSKVDGTFEFFDVLPGQYTVKGSHDHWKFITSTSDVQLSKERWEIEQPLVVRGYTIKGNIIHQSSPLISIDVLLFRTSSNNNLPTPTCSNDGPLTTNELALLPPTVNAQNFVCRTRTNAKGEYIFDDVPVGLYIVLPIYSTPTLEVVFIPDQKAITITHKDFLVQTPFETGTISFHGRVVKSTKADKLIPLSNAQIYIDGKACCQTDTNGLFKLTHIRPTGSIKIRSELDGYKFKELTHTVNLNRLIGIGDSSTSLTLSPEKVRVTGRVQCSSTRKQTIRYTDSEKKIVEKFEVEPNTEYTIYVNPGVYIFSPELSDAEIRSGVHLTPEEIDVDVSHGSPIDQINFSQLKAKLNGIIHCIDDCQNDLPKLELTSRSGVIHKIDYIQNPSKTNEIHFEQDNLLPGKYSVSLIKSKQNDKYCWKESQLEVDLSNSNKTIKFEQIGFKLRIHLQTSNKVLLKINQIKENTFTNSMDLISGLNEICLPNHGSYELIPSSCMKFENEKYFYDTSKSSSLTPIELIPIKYQVFVYIQAENDDQSTEKFPVLIRNLKQNDEFTVDLQKDKTKWTGSFWAKHGEQYGIFPRSEIWLFEPEQNTITISSDNCQSNQVKFVARRGLFINGSTYPPVVDANVSLYIASTDNQDEKSIDIDGQSMNLLLSSWTKSDGTYTFGPLSNTRSYHVVIKKAGHVFTRKSASSLYDFNSEKLASILVQIKDIDGVFLLLSSQTNNMRRRTATTDSTGEVLFEDLQPGTYYIRPQLREYKFQPEDAQIELKSGDEVITKFQFERIAFSCYGQITSLNNEPESGLIIDAIGIEQCESVTRESAKTDINGQFRLRALQPGCRYRLQYRSNPTESTQTDIIQIEPKNKIIEIIDSDLYHIHLYTIKRPSDVDINVFIQTQTQFLNQLKVKLYKTSQRESPIQTVTLTNSPFAYFNSIPLDNENYILRVDSPLSTSVYNYIQPEISFTANQTFLFFTFNYQPRLKIYDGETGLTGSYSAFIIALLIIALIFKYETLLPFAKSSYGYVREIFLPSLIKKSSSALSSSQTNDQNVKTSSSFNTINTKTSTTNLNNDNIGLTSDSKRRARVAD